MDKKELCYETIDKMKHPSDMYADIRQIEYQMQKNIHDLVWSNGRKKGDKYILSLYNKYWQNYALIIYNGKKIELTKAIIVNPEGCQCQGHIYFEDKDKNKYSFGFNSLIHQEFNIYSHIYHMINIKNRKEAMKKSKVA